MSTVGDRNGPAALTRRALRVHAPPKPCPRTRRSPLHRHLRRGTAEKAKSVRPGPLNRAARIAPLVALLSLLAPSMSRSEQQPRRPAADPAHWVTFSGGAVPVLGLSYALEILPRFSLRVGVAVRNERNELGGPLGQLGLGWSAEVARFSVLSFALQGDVLWRETMLLSCDEGFGGPPSCLEESSIGVQAGVAVYARLSRRWRLGVSAEWRRFDAEEKLPSFYVTEYRNSVTYDERQFIGHIAVGF